MPNENSVILREKTLEVLSNFPKLLEPHMDLVQTLSERYKLKTTVKPKKIIETWEEHNNFEKFFFLGWLRAAIKKMGVAQAMVYLHLKDKQEIDVNLATILDGATEEELKVFRKGEDTVGINHK